MSLRVGASAAVAVFVGACVCVWVCVWIDEVMHVCFAREAQCLPLGEHMRTHAHMHAKHFYLHLTTQGDFLASYSVMVPQCQRVFLFLSTICCLAAAVPLARVWSEQHRVGSFGEVMATSQPAEVLGGAGWAVTELL